jgi:hypothetical protein
MKKAEIITRANLLAINKDFEDEISQKTYDLIYLAVGKNYLTALGDNWMRLVNGTIILFDKKHLGENIVALPSGNNTVKSFSQSGYKVHGTTGFKGDLLRILATYASKQKDPYSEILTWTDPLYFSQLVHDLGRLDFSQSSLDFE